MADVYRAGRKSVHHAYVSGDPDDPSSPAQCNLDPGGSWGPTPLNGDRCTVCFAGVDEHGSSRQSVAVPLVPRKRRVTRKHVAAGAGGASLVALAAALFSQQGGSVSPTATNMASFGVPLTGTALVSAAPSASPPAPTPASSMGPEPSAGRTPAPFRSAGSVPSRVSPAPTLCPHPGRHYGLDPCVWPPHS